MFEEYLKDKWIKGEGSMTLDDDMPDAFDAWLQNLDVDEWIEFGDGFIADKATSYMGKKSAEKRKLSSERMSEIAKMRWNKK